MLEISRLIAEVKEKDDVRILPGDPAFALVTLNQLALEDLARRLDQGVRAGIAEFNDTVQKTETRAGKMLAQQVKEAAAAFRQELKKEIDTARPKTADIGGQIDRSYQRASLVRSGLMLLISLLVMFGIGLWTGARYLR